MEQFKYFTKEDTEIIRLNLGILSGLKNLEDRLITGFNYYYQAINPNKLIISLSFLHRSEDIRDKFIEDLVSEDNTKILLSSERTKEIPFFREKRSIYLGRPNFRIAKDPLTKESDPNVYYFDFISGEEVQTEILRRANYIDDILKLCSKYKQIGVKELRGYEINLNIKTKDEGKATLNLLRNRAYAFKINENGLPLYNGDQEEIENLLAWPLADIVPCIILGSNFEILLEENLNDFSKAQKNYIIKNEDEVSFITAKTSTEIKNNPAYLVLKKRFDNSMAEIPVFANRRFVMEYIDNL